MRTPTFGLGCDGLLRRVLFGRAVGAGRDGRRLDLRQSGKWRSKSLLVVVTLPRVYVRPALKAAEIAGKVGWHTFRHSYATILKSHGEDVKTVRELLRHANSSITLNLYAQAITDTKRSAQSNVARLVFESEERHRR